MLNKNTVEVLRVDGIYKNGYGIVPKFIMHDLDLTLESKAIYAYLCALSGSGEQAFPYRDTILRQLKLAKNTYYAHYKLLIEHGYITVERPADKTAANIYTLVSNPKKLREVVSDGAGILAYRGLKSQGYGSIPRAVMTDDRLTIKAKGLYAYFCSYCGAGRSAFPRKDHILHHLGISEPTYYKALNALKTCDYLQIEQRKVSGQFSVNDYYLNEFPSSGQSPLPNNCDTKKRDMTGEKPYLPNKSFCDTINSDTISKDLNSCDTKIRDAFIITETIINKNKNTSPTIRTKKKRSIGTTSYDLKEIEQMLGLTASGE